MKTYEYKLVVETTEESLNETVSALLLHGWQLHMGPTIAIGDIKTRYAQAMIKEIERRIP